jgi:hypothetical protein
MRRTAVDRDIFRSSGENRSVTKDESSLIRTTIAACDLVHFDAA